jgi:hypothetical protein
MFFESTERPYLKVRHGLPQLIGARNWVESRPYNFTMLEAAFFAILIAAIGFVVKAIMLRPQVEQMRMVSKAMTALRTPPTFFTTRLILESGEWVDAYEGWTPGRRPGEIVRHPNRQYEIVEVRDPVLAADESEATLVLRRVS